MPKWRFVQLRSNATVFIADGGLRSLATMWPSCTSISDETTEHADAKAALLSWHGHALKGKWQTPADVKAKFDTASILKDRRVVFNIARNKYRRLTSINYPYRIVFVKFVGMHKQYDAIDAQTFEGHHGH